ncbi:MAG: hypothetical protein WB509_31935 [Acetobacteraceae bacterium]
MATRKKVTARKAPAEAASAEQRAARQAAQPSGTNPNRLLREAAWSRMFGRVESKNPFTR